MIGIDKIKIKNIHAALNKNKLDGLVLTDVHDMKYLLGDIFCEGEAAILIHKKGLIIVTRPLYEHDVKKYFPKAQFIPLEQKQYLEVIKQAKALKLKAVAFDEEKEFFAAAKYYKKAGFKTVSNFINSVRATKTEQELKIMRESAQIAYGAYLYIRKEIKAGMTEKQVALKIEMFMRERGATAMSFVPLVSFGANGANPHHFPDDTKLTKNTAVLMDFGCVYKDYCSDITRCFWFGDKVDPEYQKILDLAIAAHDNAVKKAKYGMTGAQIDALARSIINKAGYGEYFTHRTGHGIGMQDHELADISQLNKNKIGLNYCFSIEPGIYLQGKFGVRYEDCFYMTKKGIKQIK